ncbi:Pycsar system effector family protein [Saccharothrix deserti]|uniref:Pycsar system effector family protein n=1 Tax=Saccharothrix deserti TaxID=2593674 RepID=UPI00131DE72A|nr:Pycsar system effector family protein [Saccharothrix deserti]
MAEVAERVAKRVESAQSEVADQMRRADTKAATLLPLFGGFLAGVVALTTRPLPWAAELLLWVATAPALVSVVVLLTVVRPWLSKDDGYGFGYLAGFAEKPSDLLGEFDRQTGVTAQAVDVVRLSVRVKTKYRRVRAAVDALVCSAVLLAAALAVVAVS